VLAVAKTDDFAPLAVRAALWAGDVTGVGTGAAGLEATGFWGPALEIDRITAKAGLAALSGAGQEALAGFRDALRGYRTLGLAFDEAAAAVDMATVLAPSEREAPEVAAAIQGARGTLTRLGAAPFLTRLEAAVSAGSPPANRDAEPDRTADATRVRSGSA
jgi:hypothetical protein